MLSVKRDLLQCQKRPTTVSKETYYSVKRDLLQCQKRPTVAPALVNDHLMDIRQCSHQVFVVLKPEQRRPRVKRELL